MTPGGDGRPPKDASARRADVLSVVAALAWGVGATLFGERVPELGGLGWDGRHYAPMVANFPDLLGGRALTQMDLKRCLPSAVLHYVLRALGIAADANTIVLAYCILNALCLGAVAWLWSRTADRLSIGTKGRWLGFCALVVTYPALKFLFYCPVLTDMPALALGMLAVHGYFSNRPGIVLTAMAAAAFVWPTGTLVCAPLLVFGPCAAPSERAPPRRAATVAALLALAVLALELFLIGRFREHEFGDRFGSAPPLEETFEISAVLAAVYVFFALRPLLDRADLLDPRRLFRRIAWPAAVCGGLVIVGASLLILKLSNGSSGLVARPIYFMKLFPFRAVSRPGVFLAAHTVYLGPAFVLSFLLWPRICDELRRFGPGLAVSLAIGAGLSLNSESRHLFMFVPLLVPPLVLAVERLHWAAWQYGAFAAFSFVVSKAWLPINSEAAGPASANAGPNYAFLFMYQGPWMTTLTYALAAAIALVLGIAMYVAFVRGSRAGAD